MEMDERVLWAKRLERQRDTLLTDAEYAAELGTDVSTLSAWRTRLASAPTPRALPERRCKNPRCQRAFLPNRENQAYCSRKCQAAMCYARWHRRARAKGVRP